MEKQKLLIASRNEGKIEEFRVLLSDIPFEILSLKDIDDTLEGFDVEETASTYEGNALIKAIIMGNKVGLLTLADDSGLEVEALNGRPGVFSKRYAPGTKEDRMNKMLQEMQGVEEENRGAFFQCVLALYDPVDMHVKTFDGMCEGKILTEMRGNKGFGYSALFYYKPLGKTYAEMDMEERGKISHRGRALQKVKNYLSDTLQQ